MREKPLVGIFVFKCLPASEVCQRILADWDLRQYLSPDICRASLDHGILKIQQRKTNGYEVMKCVTGDRKHLNQ
jgi:hypothetical protein